MALVVSRRLQLYIHEVLGQAMRCDLFFRDFCLVASLQVILFKKIMSSGICIYNLNILYIYDLSALNIRQSFVYS